MDHIVKAAMAKWPNVPACTGWLALDRRGRFRMRDEACQAAEEAGEPIRHAALNAFIARNYTADAEGRWFFQNGPQRVFVDLDYVPLVVRLHHGTAGNDVGTRPPAPCLIDQCLLPFTPSACWCDEQGNILFAGRRGTVPTPAADATGAAGATHDAAPRADAETGIETIALLYDQDLDLFLTLFPDAAQHMAALLTGEAAEASPTAIDADGAALHWPGSADALRCGVIDATDVPARFGFRPRPTV